MANIDVSELMSDPDFVDPLQIIYRTATVNHLGENVIEETVVETYGSIQPTSGKEYQRLPEGLRSANVRSFWVKGHIKMDGASNYPVLFLYQGERYAIKMVYDWSNFGASYSEGVAVREIPSP